MKNFTLAKALGLLATLLAPVASATFYYDTKGIQQIAISQAKRQNVAPSLVLAIAKVESNFNPQAVSHAGAKGVMQIMPRTAEQAFDVPRDRLFEPEINIELGVKFIKKLLKRYDGRLDIALSHYNGGSKVKNRYGELRVIPATRDYVDKVLAAQQTFLHHDYSQQSVDKAHLFENDLAFEETGIVEIDPQIKTLRALRIHNITRNYQNNKNALPKQNITAKTKKAFVHTSIKDKREKVRQWESIYLD
jgi:hypothetical protein